MKLEKKKHDLIQQIKNDYKPKTSQCTKTNTATNLNKK